MQVGQRVPSSAAAALLVCSLAVAQSRAIQLFEPLESAHAPDTTRTGVLDVASLDQRASLALELAPGRSVTLRGLVREDAWGGGAVWRAEIAEDPLGSATLSVLDGVVAGSVRAQRELWSIAYAGPGLHRLRRVDENSLPPCGGAIPVTPDETPAHTPLELGSAGPQTLDVLVLYTADAAIAEGGALAMEAKINLAIAESNQAYANSQVTQRLRLAHQTITAYAESGDFSTDLGRLQAVGDSHMDEAHTLRDQYCADFVVLIVAGTQYCGIAYLMQFPSVSFAGMAFSVTSRVCATGYYTFAHELGHNMGCHHDRQNADFGAYPYSYGYRTPDSQWRTVMAYAPGTRVQMFSNPNVFYAGHAMGVAHPAPNSAENWKSLELTAPVCAQFRSACPGTIESYCTPGTTVHGCLATIEASGWPSASAGSGFTLSVSGVEGLKQGIVFYGTSGRNQSPWAQGSSSYLCVAPPTQRMNVQSSGGTFGFCNGALATDWSAWVAANPAALGAPFASGQAVQAQAWFRDPGSPKNTSLSDAVEFICAP